MRNITLSRLARVFEKVNQVSLMLARTNTYLAAGTEVLVGNEEPVIYDHRDQRGIAFVDENGKTYYLLVSELGLPNSTH